MQNTEQYFIENCIEHAVDASIESINKYAKVPALNFIKPKLYYTHKNRVTYAYMTYMYIQTVSAQ